MQLRDPHVTSYERRADGLQSAYDGESWAKAWKDRRSDLFLDCCQ